MCDGGQATATIGGTSADPKTLSKPTTKWTGKQANQMVVDARSADLKDAESRQAPSLTDELLRKARGAQMLRLGTKQGRKSTFLTGPLGDTSTKPLMKTLLGGY